MHLGLDKRKQKNWMDNKLFMQNTQGPYDEIFSLKYLDCTRILTAAGLFCYLVP